MDLGAAPPLQTASPGGCSPVGEDALRDLVMRCVGKGNQLQLRIVKRHNPRARIRGQDGRMRGDNELRPALAGQAVHHGEQRELSLWREGRLGFVEQELSMAQQKILESQTCDSRIFKWRGQDLNLRPRGYEPRELPGCSTPRPNLGLATANLKHGWNCAVNKPFYSLPPDRQGGRVNFVEIASSRIFRLQSPRNLAASGFDSATPVLSAARRVELNSVAATINGRSADQRSIQNSRYHCSHPSSPHRWQVSTSGM